MTRPPENPNRDHWLAAAKQVARTVNFAWWLEALLAPLVIASITGAAVLLLVRREVPDIEPWILAVSISSTVLTMALACWARAARNFEGPEQSLVRIEAAMRLNNALTAARFGVAPWPEPITKIDAGLVWRWPRLLAPATGALVLLAAGILIPMGARGLDNPRHPEQPLAWSQLSSELDELTKEDVVDEKYLEETREKLAELQSQHEEQWFSHSSLEATDTLKNAHRAEAGRVARDLERAEKALANLQQDAGASTQAERNRLPEEFDQALQGLQGGAMKPNPALLAQMQQLDLKDMAKLAPEQVERLRENLKKFSAAMKSSEGDGEEWPAQLVAGDPEDEGGPLRDRPGSGGVDRGPGHDPRLLGAEKDRVETGRPSGLEAIDLSRATPGDLLELQDAEHDVDRAPSTPSQGGGTEATGKGGDRIWRDSLDPAEQGTLKRFFE